MRERIALGAAVSGLTAACSYALQRLLDPSGPPPELVVASTHIPFYFRAALAAVHGLAIGTAVAVAARGPRAARWLAHAERVALPVALAAAAAVALRP